MIQMTLRYSKVTSRRTEELAQQAFKKIPDYELLKQLYYHF
jgi:integrase/recombinase XerD